jgi:hypothetical protein
MMESPRIRKIGAFAAVMISWWAFYWLISLLPLRHDVLFRIGFVCAVSCALGGLAFFWGVLLSYVARWRKWSPRKCHIAGLSILIPLGILSPLVPTAHFVVIFDWAAGLALISGRICRKLAHPELTDEQAYAPEPPLTLFPK